MTASGELDDSLASNLVHRRWRWPRLYLPVGANARKPSDTQSLWGIVRRAWTTAVVFFGRQHGFVSARIWRPLLPWRGWLRDDSAVSVRLPQYPSAAIHFIAGQADLRREPNARLRQLASRTSLVMEKGSAG